MSMGSPCVPGPLTRSDVMIQSRKIGCTVLSLEAVLCFLCSTRELNEKRTTQHKIFLFHFPNACSSLFSPLSLSVFIFIGIPGWVYQQTWMIVDFVPIENVYIQHFIVIYRSGSTQSWVT